MTEVNVVPPSFFIIGAPKCGTTSLASYLGNHPGVVPPKKKEPNYFSDDLPLQEVDGLDEYLKLFLVDTNEDVISFEASTWYLYSRTAVDNILEHYPDSKFIVMIRNPVDMAQSLHSQQLYNLGEPILDFEEAWYRQFSEERKRDWLLHYKTCCETGSQLERLLGKVGREKVFLVLFDDLKDNPEKVYLDAQAFLGLDEHRLDSYEPRNRNKTFRSRLLQDFVKNTPKPIVKILNIFKRITGVKSVGLSSKIEKANEVEKARSGISPQFRNVLLKEFSAEIEKLENIFERDLSHWKA